MSQFGNLLRPPVHRSPTAVDVPKCSSPLLREGVSLRSCTRRAPDRRPASSNLPDPGLRPRLCPNHLSGCCCRPPEFPRLERHELHPRRLRLRVASPAKDEENHPSDTFTSRHICDPTAFRRESKPFCRPRDRTLADSRDIRQSPVLHSFSSCTYERRRVRTTGMTLTHVILFFSCLPGHNPTRSTLR